MNRHRLPNQESAVGQRLLKLQLLLGFPFPRDPETDAVRSAYEIATLPLFIHDEHCLATIIANEDVLELRTLETALGHRRRGHATKLMKRICRAADLLSSDIRLIPRPCDAASPDLAKLVDWFATFGFRQTSDGLVRSKNGG